MELVADATKEQVSNPADVLSKINEGDFQKFRFCSIKQPNFIPSVIIRICNMWACAARRVLSENTSHIRGSFRESGGGPWTDFQGV